MAKKKTTAQRVAAVLSEPSRGSGITYDYQASDMYQSYKRQLEEENRRKQEQQALALSTPTNPSSYSYNYEGQYHPTPMQTYKLEKGDKFNPFIQMQTDNYKNKASQMAYNQAKESAMIESVMPYLEDKYQGYNTPEKLQARNTQNSMSYAGKKMSERYANMESDPSLVYAMKEANAGYSLEDAKRGLESKKITTDAEKGGSTLSSDEAVLYAQGKINELDREDRQLLEEIVYGAKQKNVGTSNYDPVQNKNIALGGLKKNQDSAKQAADGASKEYAAREALKEKGWSDEDINLYTDYAERIGNYKAQDILNAAQTISKDMPDAYKTYRAIANTVKDVATTPRRGLNAVLANTEKDYSGLGLDTNSTYFNDINRSQYGTQQVLENAITDEHPVAQKLYQYGLSAAESAATMAAFGALGEGAGMAVAGNKAIAGTKAALQVGNAVRQATTLASFGAQAYATSYKEAKDRGATNKQAQMYGVASGLAEAGAELLPLENLTDMVKGGKVGKNFVAEWLKQAGLEATEEVVTDLANAVSDYTIMGRDGKSQFQTDVANYMADGADEKTAIKNAKMDFLKQLADDAIGGAFSGALMGGGALLGGSINAKSMDQTLDNISKQYNDILMNQSYEENNISQEQAQRYAENPAQYILDNTTANSEEAQEQRKVIEEAVAKIDNGEELSTTEKAAMNEALAVVVEDSQENYDQDTQTQSEKESVPEEFKTAKTDITADEAYKKMNDAAANGNAEALMDAYNEAKNSTNFNARATADQNLELLKNRALYNGADASVINNNVSSEDAYIKGYRNESIDVDMLSAEKQRAYNEGQQAKIRYNQNQTEQFDANKKAYKDTNTQKAYEDIYNEAKEKVNANQYDIAFRNIFNAGLSNIDFDKQNNGSNKVYADILGKDIARQIYDAGVTQAKTEAVNNIQTKMLAPTNGNVAFKDVRKNPTRDIDTAPLDAISKVLGVNVVLGDVAANGQRASYNQGKNTVFVSEDNISSIFHELGHFGKDYSAEQYSTLKKSMLNAFSESVGSDAFNREFAKYQNTYGEIGADEITDEMVNSMFVGLMSSEEGQKAFNKYINKNFNPNMVSRIVNDVKAFFKNLFDSMKRMISESHMSDIERQTYEAKINERQKLVDQYISMLEGAKKNRDSAEKGESNQETKHSLGIKETFADYEFTPNEKGRIIKMAEEYRKDNSLLKKKPSGECIIKVDGLYGDGVYGKVLIADINDNFIYPHYMYEIEENHLIGNVNKVSELIEYYEAKGESSENIRRFGEFVYGKGCIVINSNDSDKFYAKYVRQGESREGFHRNGFGRSILDGNRNVKESIRARDNIKNSLNVDSEGNNLSEAQAEYFKDSKVRDAEGRLKPVYHGTGRADRVGYFFDPDRATSGPMAFFTDNKQIAENYSKDKADTSISRDERYDSYYTQYRLNINGKDLSIGEAYNELPASKRSEIRQKAPHITFDDDYETIIYDEKKTNGLGNFDQYLLREHKNNYLEALVDAWLEQGDLYGQEERFNEVLKLVGIDNAEYLDPEFRDEKVYETYLNITNPFNTVNDVASMISDFEEWWNKADRSKYNLDMYSADIWDKSNLSIDSWINRAKDDVDNGTTHAWTTIPDAVTDYLKEKGYDGIEDLGGKGGGQGHTVYIPFYSNQIKSIDNLNPTENVDIRYSKNVDTEGNRLTEKQTEYFKDSKMRDEKGNLKAMYHGARGAGFTKFDSSMSGDERSFFFTDSLDVAKSYSGTKEIFSPDKPMGYKELSKMVGDYTNGELYLERDGEDVLVYRLGMDEDELVSRGTLEDAQKYFVDNVGDYSSNVDAVYETYLNITNPLVVDAKGEMWDSLPSIDGENEWTTREYAEYAQSEGYDGVIFNNLYDVGLYASSKEANTSTVAIVFDSEQIKSIYNLNPTSSDDIRYSLNVDDSFEDFIVGADDQISFIDDTASILEEGMSALKGKAVNENAIKRIAAQLKNEYGSRVSVNEFADQLNKVFAYMQTQDHVNYNDMMRILKDVARPVVDQATDAAGEENFKQFKDALKGYTIKLNDTQKAEVKNVFGTYANFKKAMAGVNFSDNGTSLDSIWSEIVESTGYVMDADISDAEEPLVLADTYNALKPSPVNMYGMDAEDVSKDLAMRIVEEYLGAESNKKFKDALRKKNQEYRAKAKADYDQRLKEAKELMKDRKYVSDYKHAEEIANLRAKNKESARKAKERREVVHQKERISKQAKQLMKWVMTPTEKKHVPADLVKPVSQFLMALDFVSPDPYQNKDGKWQINIFTDSYVENGKRHNNYQQIVADTREDAIRRYMNAVGVGVGSQNTQRWSEKMRAMEDLFEKNADTYTDQDMVDFVTKLDSGLGAELKEVLNEGVANINQLGSAELKVLNNVLRNITHAINQENKAYSTNEDMNQLGAETIVKGSEKNDPKISSIKKTLMLDNATPITFFENLGESGKKIYNMLREGLNTQIMAVKKANEYMEDVLKDVDKKELAKWTGDNARIHEFDLRDGVIRMTEGEIMALYETMKRDGALERIAGGIETDARKEGFKKVPKSKAFHTTNEDLKKIIGVLTDEQKAIADKMQWYLANECAKQGNEVSLKLYGYEKFLEEHYFPYSVDQKTTVTNDTNIDIATYSGIEHSGFTKSKKEGAKNPLIIKDIFDVFTDHVSGMASYYGYAAAIKDTMRWFNFKEMENTEDGFVQYKTVKDAVDRITGIENANNYVKQLVLDLNQSSKSQYIGNFTERLIGNYKASAVGANIRVIAQQPTALFRAMAVINPKYFAEGLNPVQSAKMGKIANDESAIMWWKSQGYYETMMAQSMKSTVTGIQNRKDWLTEKLMAGAGKADDITWAYLYNVVEHEVKDQNPKLSGQELRDAVNERFDYMVDKTQVVDSTLHRSQLMRSKDKLNVLQTAFMAEPTKTYNLLMSSLTSGDKKKVAMTVAAVTLTNVVNAAAQSLVDMLRRKKKDDEWDETFADNYLANLIDNVNPFSYLPVIKDINSKIMNLIQGNTTSSDTRLDTASIQSVLDFATDIMKGNKTTFGLILSGLKPLSNLTGVPLYNFSRDFASLLKIFGIYLDTKPENKTDKLNAVKKALENGRDPQEAIGNAIEFGLNISDIDKKIQSTYSDAYLNSVMNGDTEAQANLTQEITEAYKKIGKSDEYIQEKLDDWSFESASYDDLDAAVENGQNIFSVITDLRKAGKKDEDIAKHLANKYEDTIAYIDQNELKRDLKDGYEYAMEEVGKSYYAKRNGYADIEKAITGGDLNYKETVKVLIDEEIVKASDIKKKITTDYTKPLIKDYYDNKADVGAQLSRIAEVKAQIDRYSKMELDKKWHGDYLAYEKAQIEDKKKEYREEPW